MYSITLLALLVIVLVQVTYGFYHVVDQGNERAPMCATPNKPCRLLVSMGTFGGNTLESNGVPTCTCSPPYGCSEDWDKPGHVVRRKVVSTSFNITLQMMFCRPVVPLNFCRRGRISLELKGSMHMPMDITAYNCRCRRRQPLVLAERRFGEDYLTYHSYKCANHMRTCGEGVPCMTMNSYDTQYRCQCRDGLQCRTMGSRTEGYCLP